ncbi:MAG: hypothetical protein A2Y77_11090 [Planctomycetes bacterium RBG_13_62_9]|nr:MAG: hypothetical protein A2Y77_11090 [Planctomycetes bacterium RBG_13_62_9]
MLFAAGLLAAAMLLALFFKQASVRRTSSGSKSGAGGQSASVSRTDGRGNVWDLDRAGGGDLVSTDPNGPKAGPPILVKTDVFRTGAEASIGLILEGQAGEQYRPVVKKNGTPRSAPTLKIVNEAGQVLVEDSFKYG